MIDLTRKGRCAVLTLNRPSVLNALNFAQLDRLDEMLDRVNETESRALIIAGAGDRAFCAGADIDGLEGRSMIQCKEGAERGQAVFQKLEDLPIPSIAAINGFALGGGLELAMACTFRLAVPKARFGLPEIKLGLIPGYGGTQRLPRLIGQARAQEMILTGMMVDAERALSWGLINHIVDGDPVEAAERFAEVFMEYSLLALQFARSAIRRSAETSLREGLKSEAELSALAFVTEDSIEGMRAFLEKRKPQFKDR